MRKTSLAMVRSCLLWCCALASVTFGSTGDGDPIGQPGNGRLIVAVHSDGGWVEVGDPAFGKHPAGRVFDLSNHEISVPVRVKVSHDGPTAAHIDSLLVDGRGPIEVQGASEDALLAVIKAGKTDHDLIDVRGRTLIFVFDAVSDAGRLSLTARIEPVRISKIPFHYPPDNLYGKVDETSTFYPYAFDSHRGRLEVDGSLESEGLGEPFFEAYSKTGTGHPSDFTYGWIRNDDENLYVALDFVPDNTMDGAADYARVYVNTPSGVRRYEVSVPDQRWGMPGFSYTSRAAYQHKVYEFSIPFDELGVHPHSTTLPLELAFAAYGTAAPTTADIQVSKIESIDPVVAGSAAGNLVYVVTVFNDGPADVTGLTISEDLTLPAGVTRDSVVPSTGSYVDTTAPDGTWALDLADQAIATLTMTLTVDPSVAFGTDVISNTATVTAANETLTNPGDDSATESTSVDRRVDLVVTKTESIDPVTAGSGAGNLTYVVTVTNQGPSDASGVTLSEVMTLPAGVTIESVVPSGGTTFVDTTWTIGDLVSGASETLTVTLTVSGSTAGGTDIISNTATVTAANETLTNTGDDSATESTSVFGVDDFGDAPDSYGTLLASNGARHSLGAGSSLGPVVDGEADGQPSAVADGDDLNPPAAPDDEDGVNLPAVLYAGVSASVDIDGGPSGGMLDGWIDFNGDGDFGDAGEQLWGGGSQAVVPGLNNLSFTVPAAAVPGSTYARFRLSSAGSLTPNGPAPDGEVEDYRVQIALPVGTIIIEKQTDPDGSPQSFEFSSDYGPNFTLSDGATNNSGPLTPGTYSVSEVNLPASWSLTSATCDDGSDPSAIALGSGETVTCTFSNTQAIGTIIIEKQTDPDGSPQSFEFSSDYGPNFTLSDGATNNSGPLTPGTYSVSEVNIPASWSLTSATCDDGSDPSAIALGSGETVTCVFNNSALDTDGDGILDSDEGPPSEDRDGDGVPNYLDFDPSGYFYDEVTGEILSGGSISISGPGVITVLDDGSATGQYSWIHDGTQGDYTMTVTYPPGWAASAACLDLGILNPGATPDPLNLGAGENGSTGFLTSWDCGGNSFYTVLRVDATNPANIINDNIPMMAVATAIPALGDRGVMMLVLFLLVAGTLILRRNF